MRSVTKLLMLLCLLLVGQCAFAQTSGTVTYVYTDPQGTPLAEADASGNITATFDYTPYGTTALGSPPNGPGYTGHVNDPETNLVYMQARYYDPVTAHFLSIDPMEPMPGNNFSFNRYDYADNNPGMNTDPTGMCDSPGTPDPICPSPQRSTPTPPPSPVPPKPQSQPTPEVSPQVQRMRDTSNYGGIWKVVDVIKDRSSFTAEGAAALGGGFQGSATKEVGNSKDSVGGSFVIGEGGIVDATYNFKVYEGAKSERSGLEFTVDPSSYLKIKLGAGFAMGVVIKTDPYGAHSVSVQAGGGIGEEVIYKPPVNIGVNYNLH